MNDNTILRIKVPAHLYEAVKAQLTLNEAKGKQNLGAGMEVVKEKKSSGTDKPKKASAPKSEAPKKKAAAKAEAPKDGHKKVEKKERSLDELKAAYEVLGEMIAEMEKGKEKVEESKETQLNEEEYDRIRDLKSALGSYPNRSDVEDYLGLTPEPNDTPEQIQAKSDRVDYYMNLLGGNYRSSYTYGRGRNRYRRFE